jgi:type IV secretory pathway VirB10-like protein
VAVAGFAGSFMISGLLGLGEAPPPPKPQEAAKQQAPPPPPPAATVLKVKEAELEQLIRDLRRKREETDRRAAALAEREKRLEMAEAALKASSRELEELMTRANAAYVPLEAKLQEIRSAEIQMSVTERTNLKQIAATYDKMDSSECGKIITEMCKDDKLDDAVKLLALMQVRPAANALSELQDKALAARLTDRWKRIRQETPGPE